MNHAKPAKLVTRLYRYHQDTGAKYPKDIYFCWHCLAKHIPNNPGKSYVHKENGANIGECEICGAITIEMLSELTKYPVKFLATKLYNSDDAIHQFKHIVVTLDQDYRDTLYFKFNPSTNPPLDDKDNS